MPEKRLQKTRDAYREGPKVIPVPRTVVEVEELWARIAEQSRKANASRQ